MSADQAYMSRNDDDANVLSLAADLMDDQTSKKIVSVWLQTPFSGEEKHRRRIQKIKDIESSLGM
jgi:ribose 5-phosphate isomerase RpiB